MYLQLFKSVPYPSIILKVNGDRFTITNANDAYLKLCSIELESILEKDFFNIFPISPYLYPDIWAGSFESVLCHKTIINLGIQKLVSPINVRSKLFDIKYYEIQHIPIIDGKGEVQYIVRTLKDMTQQVIQEELYNESQKSAKYGNWWFNTLRNTMDWSIGFKDILEVPHDFKPSLETAKQFYLCTEEEKGFYDSVDEAIAKKEIFKTVLPIITANKNKRWLLLIGKPVIVKDICVGMRGIAKDVTEKHTYIDQIENQYNNLRDIAFAQSHLVREPLARILALVDYMKHKFTDKNIDSNLLDALNHSANELDDVIHTIVQKANEDGYVNCSN